MSDLLVHIGYPKTGTTTLQKGIFHKLDEKEIINYVGRGSKQKFLDWNNKFVRRDDINQDLVFSEEKLNVFSDERLTNQEFYSKMRYMNDSGETRGSPHPNPLEELTHNPFNNASRVKSTLGEYADDIKILVTLRNQPKIVHSLYAYTYHTYQESEYDTWQKYFSHFVTENYLQKDFYYDKLLKKYEEIFGKENIHVVLFEHLKHNPNKYIEEIREILNIDTNIEEFITLEPQNVAEKTDEYYVNQYRNPNLVEKKIPNKLKSGVRNGLQRSRITGLLPILKKAYDLIAFNEGKNKVQKISEEEINQILNIYEQSNMRLTRYNNIDQNTLSEYDYI
jgi:hypothetical protein